MPQLSLQKCIVYFATEYIYFICYEVCTCVNIQFGNLGCRKYDILEQVEYYACERCTCIGIKYLNAAIIDYCGRFLLYIGTAKRRLRYRV